jgi:adenosine deaminase
MVTKAREAGLRLTTHAGEVPGLDSPREVSEAIEVLNAERIGHGIHIINDIPVMDLRKENDIIKAAREVIGSCAIHRSVTGFVL